MSIGDAPAAAYDLATHDPYLSERDPLARSSRQLHLFRTALIGLLAGLVAVGFKYALSWGEELRHTSLTYLHLHFPAAGWLALPLAGGLIGLFVGLMTQKLAPEAGGSGIPHLKGVLMHVRTLKFWPLAAVKFVGGVLGIGAGLSLGREGPTVQMGAAIAQAISDIMKVPRADVPQLLSAGAGAGLAAAFNAPLAGLVFIVEELHRELSSRTAIGGLVACVVATVVAHSLSGDLPTFEVHSTQSLPLAVLPWVCAVSVVSALGGVLFNKGLLKSQDLAIRASKRVPRWTHPGIVCATIGLIAWWSEYAPGGGHHLAQGLLSGGMSFTIGTLFLLLALKFVLTWFSYATGAPGGIFAPMLLLGLLIGQISSVAMSSVNPELAQFDTEILVLSMAAFFVASVRVPLTGIVLISELTGGYALLLPICIAAGVGFVTAEALRDHPIYEALLEADLHRKGQAVGGDEPVSIYIGIQNGSSLADRLLRQAGLPKGCLVVGVERGGKLLHPAADLELRPGDHITVLCPGNMPEAPSKVVQLCTGI
ncbi:MAG: H(+)/Cl(-) exchange transporter ClcA [Phycisphaerales bacterium]|jgi:CIC family chloride channel protein